MDLEVELKSLLEELQLSDELIIKFKLMVEGKIQEKVEELTKQHQEEIAALEEQHTEVVEGLESELELVKEKAEDFGLMLQEKAEEYAQKVQDDTLEEATKYAEYVVESFIEENKEALLKEDEYNKMKTVFETIKESFQEQLFALEPADTAIQAELDEVKSAYSKVFEDYSSIKKELSSLKKEMLFESKTKNLADSQKEKVSSLIESINPKSLEEYGKGIDIIISQLGKQTMITESLDSGKEIVDETKPDVSDKMSSYLKFL